MPMARQKLSVIVPLYRCSRSIAELHRRAAATTAKAGLDYEIVFVNDASPENDWEVVCGLAARDPRIIGINLSRNFGQHTAITAGIDAATGDWLVVMDGDLQDQPEEIGKLYAKASEGFDIVYARRTARVDGFFKKLGSRLFNKFFSLLAGRKTDPAIGNFSIISSAVAAEMRRIRERNRSYPQFLLWLGFRTATVDVAHAGRTLGTSSYTFRRLVRFALANIFAFSNRPLHVSIGVGFAFSALSFAYAVFAVARALAEGGSPPGWTSLVCAVFFVGGLILATIGIVGIYLGQVFDEVKGRPLYVIAEKTGAHTAGRRPHAASGKKQRERT